MVTEVAAKAQRHEKGLQAGDVLVESTRKRYKAARGRHRCQGNPDGKKSVLLLVDR